MGQVYQQKAEQALLRVVEQSKDPELVHNVAKAKNPQQLLDIGLSNEEVGALIKFKDQIVWPKVVEAGNVRSMQLEAIAIHELKGQIASVVDPDLLNLIAAANSNSDLQGIGLDDGYVVGLWRDTAFEPLKEQAQRQLLAIEARALDALLLEVGSADEEKLKKVVLVTNNEGLKTAGLNADNVDALYRPEAHTQVVDQAKLLLVAAIELRKQQALQSPHVEPHVDHGPKKMGNEGVDLEREAREPKPKPTPTRVTHLMEENGLAGYKDEVVKLKDVTSGFPAVKDTYTGGNTVMSLGTNRARYQGVAIGEEDAIRSSKVLKGPDGKVNGVAIVQVDHAGRVTDRSMGDYAKWSEEQKTELAFRQAQMHLTNYRPGHGNIIIRGSNPEMATKVHAALLVLKEQHPELKDVQIKSWVKGADAPATGMLTRTSTANTAFIKKHLDEHTVNTQGEALAKQVATTTETRFNRLKALNAMGREEAQKHGLKIGDTLEQTGEVTRAPTKPK